MHPKPGHSLPRGIDVVLSKKVSGGLFKFNAVDTVENPDTGGHQQSVRAVFELINCHV